MAEPIVAVTFDLWDTVFVDDSDEPKRAAKGLGTKVTSRKDLLLEVLGRHYPVTRVQVDEAYSANDEIFRHIWHEDFKTLTVENRIEMLLKDMDMKLPNADLREVVRGWEEMEYEIPPDLAPGIGDALEALAGKYSLGVISDAIVSPGRVLRMILDHYGLKEFFGVFTFSDEIGASKPEPIVFTETIRKLGVRPDQAVHIGDRGHNDIQGPHKIGMKAILYTAVKPRPMEQHQPDAVCEDYKDLPGILAEMSGEDA